MEENTNTKQSRKGINFFLAVIALILGSAIYRQFDFERLEFEKPALAVLYIVVFVAALVLIVKDFTNRSKT